MALKKDLAAAAMAATALAVNDKSWQELPEGWLALAGAGAERRLLCASRGENAYDKMWQAEKVIEGKGGVTVRVLPLNANNAAVVRRFVKSAGPRAMGSKGTTVGFSDWLGLAGAYAAVCFVKKQLKPVLVDFTPAASAALGRNFLEAVDTATWGALELGYKDGYGANAAGLTSEEEIVKALLYGYSMIGFDCSDKINLEIEKLTDAAVDKRFEDFPEAFRAALHASYLNAEFQVSGAKIAFGENELHRIVLEYGEAIMHAQFIYNSYLKNTPWDIDFELSLSKPGKVLTPAEHYLIANELQRNGIKLSAVCLDPLKDEKALRDNLELHCRIADTFGYRLSFANADLALADPAAALKHLKGKAHFKLGSLLWLSALAVLERADAELYGEICAAAGAEPVPAAELYGAAGRELALAYARILDPQKELAGRIREALAARQEEYATEVQKAVDSFLKRL